MTAALFTAVVPDGVDPAEVVRIRLETIQGDIAHAMGHGVDQWLIVPPGTPLIKLTEPHLDHASGVEVWSFARRARRRPAKLVGTGRLGIQLLLPHYVYLGADIETMYDRHPEWFE